MAARTRKCRTRKCQNIAQWRDVCRTCHREIEAAISAGKITDDEAVKLGLWSEKHAGRPRIGRLAEPLEAIASKVGRKFAKVGAK